MAISYTLFLFVLVMAVDFTKGRSDMAPPRTSVPGVFPALEEQEFVIVIKNNETRHMYGMFKVQSIIGSVRIENTVITEKKLDKSNWTVVVTPFRQGKSASIVSTGELTSLDKNKIIKRVKDITKYVDGVAAYLSPPIFTYAILLVSKKPSLSARVVHSICDDFLTLPSHSLCTPVASFTSTPFCCLTNQTTEPLPLYTEDSINGMERMIHMTTNNLSNKRVHIVLAGGKNTGKSTLSKMIVNRLIEELGVNDRPIYYLDADPGQSEFTPVACLSLHTIRSYILDQPFSHQSPSFELAYFLGDVSPKDDKIRYMNCFTRLWEKHIDRSPSNSIVVVNTMGWVKDIGLNLLNGIVDKVQPQFILSCASSNSFPEYNVGAYFSAMAHSQINVVWRENFVNRNGTCPSASTLRDMRISSYFSQCLSHSHLSISSLCEVPPLRNSLENMTIVIPDMLSALHDRSILASLNMQIVGLCSWDTFPPSKTDVRRLLNNDHLPWIVIQKRDNPPLRVIALALIRGIDIDKRVMYLLSPIEKEKLKDVDCIVRSQNILIPQCIMDNQHSSSSVPYFLKPSTTSTLSRQAQMTVDLYGEFKNKTGFLRSRGHQK